MDNQPYGKILRDMIAYQKAKTLAEASTSSEIEHRAEALSEGTTTGFDTATLDFAVTSQPMVDIATDERTI